MQAGQALIEKYWTAVYTSDADTLKNILHPNINVTVVEPDGSKLYLNSSQELIDLDQKIGAAINSIISTSRDYNITAQGTNVDFNHKITLTTKDVMHTEGYQNWTTQVFNNILVLASLLVSEKPVGSTSLTPMLLAKV